MAVSLRYSCSYCPDRFTTERGKNIHLARRHKDVSTSASNPLACPECGRDDFNDTKHLGRHRRFEHKVIGRAARAMMKKMTAIERTIPSNETSSSSTGSTAAAPPAPSPEAIQAVTYALAVGAVKEFCRHHAEEHGIPSREFTRRFAELFLRETRR